MKVYTNDQWALKVAAGTVAGRKKALRARKVHAGNEALNIERRAKKQQRGAWPALADRQIAADKAVDRIAAVKLAADVATHRTLVELERLNERAHELHVRRLEKLKRSFITL